MLVYTISKVGVRISIKLKTATKPYINVGCSSTRLGKSIPINIKPDKLLSASNQYDNLVNLL